VKLGKRAWVLEKAASPFSQAHVEPGHSEVWLRREDGLTARILLADDIRENARDLVAELHRLKMRTLLLTGDQSATAELARQAVGIQQVQSGLKPEDKLRTITALKRQGERVAMVGDGVNDAPSLAAAEVGVAMGARGSDAALEQADVVLMHDKLENFLTALRLSQKARTIIYQNLFISLGTVVLLVGFALAGAIPLTLGVVGHEGSTVVVVMNSLRLLLRGSTQTAAGEH
jgi:Cd2+/Zn2+-exporting ATPase